jgi:hypothetical protein
VHVHVSRDREPPRHLAGGRAEDEPIVLADIDRVLADSADVEQASATAPVRAWRDDLTMALESLAYARAVLAADVNILRHCLVRPGADVVEVLPSAMSPGSAGETRATDGPEGPDVRIDWDVCVRSDELLSAHQQMAQADLSSSEEVTRLLTDVEAQLTGLADRQDAVERRLQEVRSAIVRQYERGEVPAQDWLG